MRTQHVSTSADARDGLGCCNISPAVALWSLPASLRSAWQRGLHTHCAENDVAILVCNLAYAPCKRFCAAQLSLEASSESSANRPKKHACMRNSMDKLAPLCAHPAFAACGAPRCTTHVTNRLLQELIALSSAASSSACMCTVPWLPCLCQPAILLCGKKHKLGLGNKASTEGIGRLAGSPADSFRASAASPVRCNPPTLHRSSNDRL